MVGRKPLPFPVVSTTIKFRKSDLDFIDKLIELHGDRLNIKSRSALVRLATKEYVEKLVEKLAEEKEAQKEWKKSIVKGIGKEGKTA